MAIEKVAAAERDPGQKCPCGQPTRKDVEHTNEKCSLRGNRVENFKFRQKLVAHDIIRPNAFRVIDGAIIPERFEL